MRTFQPIVAIALLLVSFGSTLAGAKNAAGDERAIRDLDALWSNAAGAKDLDKTVAFYADDASMLPSNAPVAHGKDAIRAVWSQFMSMPGYAMSFAPTKVVVATSREMAYEIGTYQFTANDAQGKPSASPGKFVVVWGKRGGQWKVIADIFNPDK